MNIIGIVWIIMIIVWVMIAKNYTSARKPSDQNKMNHSGRQNEVNHSFRHYDKERKEQKDRRKNMKDSGLVSDDEYDVRNL